MAKTVLNKNELKIKELESKIKELESTNLILQEYFSLSPNLNIEPVKRTPYSGRPEFSQVFNFTIDLNLQRVVWLDSKIKDILGISHGRIFLKNIQEAANNLIINTDRKRFVNIINDFTLKNFGTYQTLFRFKHTTQNYCWHLTIFEIICFEYPQENYLQVQAYQLDGHQDMIEHLKEFIKTNTKGDLTNKIDCLTVRQREILVLFGKGLSSKEIAERLSISFHTVEAHRKSISKKTKTRKRAALISLAAETGII